MKIPTALLCALLCALATPTFAKQSLMLVLDTPAAEPTKFAAEEIRREASAKGMTLADGPNATKISLIVEKDRKTVAQSYHIRVQTEGGRRTITVRGADATGAMYGGLDVAEAIRLGTLDTLKDSVHTPYVAQRGIKFNIPLDKRQPSFDDNGTSGQENFQHVWDLAFWKDYLDTIAKQRYNVLSLWNRHPFPTLVKVPGYEGVAIDDVYNKKGLLIKKMPHAEKVKFWNDVIAYAQDRGIDVWWYVWNIHVYGSEETKYGLTDSPDNAITKDYLRKSVTQLFRTYPKLKGLGMCPGENFGDRNKDHDFKEQWCWDTYGEGILDYKKENPARKIEFVHRYWLTDFKYIGQRFNKLPDGYDLEYKYSRARLYSAPNPPFVKKDILDDTPASMKTWWNLRNDDIFLVRWGDPDYVKQAVLAFPGNGRTAGYVLGSDRFCWGRESASKTPSSPRQLENEKHWYSFMLWGRLGYDPQTSPQLLKALIADRFKLTEGAKLYETWQAASRIIPLVNRTRYVPWDYMWWVEGCRGNLLDRSIRGFHTVDIFLDKRWGGMDGTDHIGIPQYVAEGKTSGITPLASADQLDALALEALKGAAEINDAGKAELRETLGDIRTQARLGQYYASKIRGAVSVGLFRKTGEAQHQTEAVAHLEKALTAWHNYAKELDANYTNLLYISGQRTFDWFDDSGPKSDIAIAKKGSL
jgi:hypothetical protein